MSAIVGSGSRFALADSLARDDNFFTTCAWRFAISDSPFAICYNAHMQEYVTDAVVLTKRPSGEFDARYTLLTKKFGKMTGRAKSSRKITSKLAGHLEPGSVIKVRFIEKSGVQIVDALKVARVDISQKDLATLEWLIPEMEADAPLWDLVAHGPFSWSSVIKTLGWDPAEAVCVACGRTKPTHFFIPRQEFFCDSCVSKLRSNEVSLIKIGMRGISGEGLVPSP
jgi:Recombination protein O N terminal